MRNFRQPPNPQMGRQNPYAAALMRPSMGGVAANAVAPQISQAPALGAPSPVMQQPMMPQQPRMPNAMAMGKFTTPPVQKMPESY